MPFDNGDSADVANADPTIYGICGEETSMNTLQLITDMGDTLVIDISDAQDNNKVLGGIAPGDRMAVLADAKKTTAEIVINQAPLGLSIKEGGIVEGIDQANITYKTWRLSRGKLEIVLVREGGSEDDEAYFYDIVKLGADSLVIKDADETYEYSRQKPKEGYGVDIKLEDAQNEFFM